MTLWDKRQQRMREQESHYRKVEKDAVELLKSLPVSKLVREKEWEVELIEKGEISLVPKNFKLDERDPLFDKLIRLFYDDDDLMYFLRDVVEFRTSKSSNVHTIHADEVLIQEKIVPYLFAREMVLEIDPKPSKGVADAKYKLRIREPGEDRP